MVLCAATLFDPTAEECVVAGMSPLQSLSPLCELECLGFMGVLGQLFSVGCRILGVGFLSSWLQG